MKAKSRASRLPDTDKLISVFSSAALIRLDKVPAVLTFTILLVCEKIAIEIIDNNVKNKNLIVWYWFKKFVNRIYFTKFFPRNS
jgi:hypothetical protein